MLLVTLEDCFDALLKNSAAAVLPHRKVQGPRTHTKCKLMCPCQHVIPRSPMREARLLSSGHFPLETIRLKLGNLAWALPSLTDLTVKVISVKPGSAVLHFTQPWLSSRGWSCFRTAEIYDVWGCGGNMPTAVRYLYVLISLWMCAQWALLMLDNYVKFGLWFSMSCAQAQRTAAGIYFWVDWFIGLVQLHRKIFDVPVSGTLYWVCKGCGNCWNVVSAASGCVMVYEQSSSSKLDGTSTKWVWYTCLS